MKVDRIDALAARQSSLARASDRDVAYWREKASIGFRAAADAMRKVEDLEKTKHLRIVRSSH